MARPARNANPSQILSPSRTFFVTTKTSRGRALLQSERNATLWIDVRRSYVAARKFQLHDFVVMPDPVHLLITVGGDMTLERAMVRVNDRESLLRHRHDMAQNPGKAGLVGSTERFPYCFSYLAKQKEAGAKARESNVTTRHG